MRYLHADYVRRAATRAAHALLAPLVLQRAQTVARGRVPVLLERRVARYLAVVEGQIPIMHAADTLGLSRSQLKRGLATIEDMRDDPVFDGLLDELALELFAC